MKQTLTVLCLMIAVAGCKERVTTESLVKRAFTIGWKTGANSVTKMMNERNYDYEKLILQHHKDSVDFANLIDK